MNLKTFMYKVRSMRRARLVHVALFLVVAVFFFQFFANTSRVSATPPYTLISQSTPIPDFQFTIRDGAGVVYTVNQDVGDPNLVYFRDSAGFDCSIVIWGYPKDATDGATARIADGQTVEDRNCAGNDSGDFESNFGTIDRSVTINGSPTSPGGGGAGETADITETCESRNPGLGWLLCKVMQFSVSVLDALTIGDSNEEGGQGFLGNILNFDLAGGQQDALRTVWSGFRVLANSLFAIIFLLVIYAAATGNGIGPYNLKRLLPRLIISAITVQLSFSISIILLDLFNSFGRGASSLILSPLPDEAFNNFIGDVPFVNQLGALALSALFLLLTIVVVALAIVGILIMGAVFILRNIGLVMLIILSPIAFALWVLPNTERIFRKWWEWFIQLLAIFPLAAMLLASGRLVSYVWIGASEGGGNEQVGEGGIGAALIATLAIFLPYYLGPRLFQFAGGVIGRVGNTAQGMQRNLENREFMQRGKAKYKAKAFERADKAREGIKNPSAGGGTPGFLRKGLGAAASSKVLSTPDKALERYSNRAQKTFDRMKAEEVESANLQLQNRENYVKAEANKANRDPDKAAIGYLGNVLQNEQSSDEQRRAAFSRLANIYNNDEDAVRVMRETLTGRDGVPGDMGLRGSSDRRKIDLGTQLVNENIGVLNSKTPAIFKGEAVTHGKTEDVMGMSAGQMKDIMRSTASLPADRSAELQSNQNALVNQFIRSSKTSEGREDIDLTKLVKVFNKLDQRIGAGDATAVTQKNQLLTQFDVRESTDPVTKETKVVAADYRYDISDITPPPPPPPPPPTTSGGSGNSSSP